MSALIMKILICMYSLVVLLTPEGSTHPSITLTTSGLSCYHTSLTTTEGNTVGENIIATIKIRNNYGAIQSFIFPTLR